MVATWRPAKAISTFRDQCDQAAPKRSRLSDGTIGDAAHRSRSSDHNAWFPPPAGGIVTAYDLTHDQIDGIDCQVVTGQLVAVRDNRIKYLIWNRSILDSRPGFDPWRWKPYVGSNPHTLHMHMSLLAGAGCDDPRPWKIPLFGVTAPPTTSTPGVVPTVRLGSRVMMRTTPIMVGTDVSQLQRVLRAWYPRAGIGVDGKFGPRTEDGVRTVQRGAGLPNDGKAGPATLRALRMT